MGLLTRATYADLGTTEQAVYTAPTGKNAVLIGGNIANKLDTIIRVDIYLKVGSSKFTILRSVAIPVNDAFSFSGSEQKIVLNPGDQIVLKSNSGASADIILSVSEMAV